MSDDNVQVKSDIGDKLKEASDDPSLPLCWKGQKPFKSISDAKKYFKSVLLGFVNGKKPLEIPPENYLIVTVRFKLPSKFWIS